MFPLSPDEWVTIGLSLRIATVATLVSLSFGIATALLLARGRFPGKSLIDGSSLPLVLPPVVTGFALLLLFGQRGPIGSLLADLGIVVAFRWTGAALAAIGMAFPLMVRAIRLSLEAIDPRLEAAAGTLPSTGAQHAAKWAKHPSGGRAAGTRRKDHLREVG